MEIRELRTFLALADTLSYQKASERLGYAPSTLSHHIRLLEQELGVTLFVKVGKQIQLTQDAAAFTFHARRLLAGYEEALSSVGAGKNACENISIGGCESTIGNGLVDLFASFTAQRDGVRLRQRTSANAQVPDMIRDRHADVGIFYSRDVNRLPGLQGQGLFKEPMRVVVSRNHPFADQENVRFEAFEGMEFAFPHDDCPCPVCLLQALDRRGVTPGAMHYLGVVPLVLEKLQSGGAATVLPYSTARRFESVYGLRYVQLEAEFWLNVRILYRSYDALSACGRALVEHSLRYAKRMIADDPTHFLPPDTDE